MNKEEVIIKNCPHVSYTDYGVWACSLYKPMDKNSFVKFGTCGANSTCPYKIAELKTQECERLKKQLMQKSEVDMFFNTPIEGWSNDPCGICPHKAENEELEKTISDFISDNRSMYCYDDRQPITLEEMQECMEFTYKVGLKYKQALEEIEKELKECVYCEGQECACDDFEECLKCTKNIILDIIRKAKGADNHG